MLAEVCEAMNLPSRGKGNTGSFLLIISPLLFLECRLSWDKTGAELAGAYETVHDEKGFLLYKSFCQKYAPWVDIKQVIKLAKCLQASFHYSGLAGKPWPHTPYHR